MIHDRTDPSAGPAPEDPTAAPEFTAPPGRLRRILQASAAFAVMAAALGASWATVVGSEHDALHSELAATAPQIAGRLSDFIGSRVLAAETLRFSMEQLSWDEEDFRRHANVIRTEFGGYRALSWVDPGGTIRWVTPVEGNEGAIGRSLWKHPQARDAFSRAFETGGDTISRPARLFQGGRGFAAYLPIGSDRGFVNVVFDLDDLLERGAGERTLANYAIELRAADHLAWRSPGFDSAPEQLEERVPVDIGLAVWELRVRPGPPVLDAHRDAWLWWAFGTGLLLLAIASVGLYFMLDRAAQREHQERWRRQLAEQLGEARRLEALARMAGGVAHDFNNILTAIMGAVRHAEDETDDAARSKLLSQIDDAARRGAELTRHLLSYARRDPVQSRPVNLSRDLDTLRTMLERLLPENVELSVKSQDGLWSVQADPGDLHRVVLNLVVNAADALPGGGRIQVNVVNRTDGNGERPPGEWVELCVSDDGTGMTDEVRERIFEPFFTTKDIGQGTGLGLATVFGVVQQLGGGIDVETAPGEGTTVRVWLPRAAQEAPTPSPRESTPDPVRGEGTILLVEDDAVLAMLARRTLERRGYQVHPAGNADEALALGVTPDVLVTDVVLPGRSGPQLAEELKRRHPSLRVVFVSGWTQDRLEPGLLERLDAGFVAKPYRPADLAAAVAQARAAV